MQTRRLAAHVDVGGGWPPEMASAANYSFDPLYVEDPLRPSNNVGRNCFRIYAIQQEFAKAHNVCANFKGAVPPSTPFAPGAGPDSPSRPKYPILRNLLSALRDAR